MSDAPEGFMVEVDALEDVSEEDYDRLSEDVDEFTDLLREYEKKIDEKVAEVNDNEVLEELGIYIHVESSISFAYGERE